MISLLHERATMAKAPSATVFFALVEETIKDGGRTKKESQPQRIEIDNKVAVGIASTFETMAATFFSENRQQIDFDGRYLPDPGEIFKIDDFAIDPALLAAAHSPLKSKQFVIASSPYPVIRAIAASTVTGPKPEDVRIVFQEFRADRIIREGFALFHQNGTFTRVDHSGLTISGKIDAVFEKGTLYFKSYYSANRFVDLTNYFKDASDEDVRGLLKSKKFSTGDEEALLKVLDNSMRRKLGAIEKNNPLDTVTPEALQAAGKEFDIPVDIDVSHGKKSVVLPSTKPELKDLLYLLHDGLYKSPITQLQMLSNSHRPRPVGAKPAPKKATVKKKAFKKKAAAKRK